MDAVNPDYLVVHILNPTTPTMAWILPGNLLFGRFPVLTGLYHASYPSYETLPFYLLLGGTIASIRLAHLCIGLMILVAAGALIRQTTRSPILTGAALVALAADPAFLFPFRTQAHITVFPVFFFFLTLYMISRYPTARGYFTAGALLGLSVCGYFIFVFALPGVLLFALRDRASIRHGRHLATLITGFALGMLPYALGYGLLFGALGLQPGIAWIQTALLTLHVDSGQSSYGGRIGSVLEGIWLVCTGEWNWLIFWSTRHVDYGQMAKTVMLVILPLAALRFSHRSGELGRGFALVGLSTLSFVIMATVFGNRLGGQDLVTIVPMLYVLAAVSVSVLLLHFQNRIVTRVSAAALTILFAFNVTATGTILAKLSGQGGSGLYSSIISQYPRTVLARQDKTPHIFWDWGAMMPFIYLTEGTVPVFDNSQLSAVLCQYGKAKLVFLGEDAVHPKVAFMKLGVKTDAVQMLRDAHSSFPYKVITVSPLHARCAPAPILPGFRLPKGVYAHDLTEVEGVYPDLPSRCCFLANHATFGIITPVSARSLTLNVYVPNVSIPDEQRLTIRIDGGAPIETGILKKGTFAAVRIPLPPSHNPKKHVEILPAYSFVPKDLGMNADDRHLSVILTSVSASANATP